MLESVGPVDLIVYAGDDTERFVPPVPFEAAEVLARRCVALARRMGVAEERIWLSIEDCLGQPERACWLGDPEEFVRLAAKIVRSKPVVQPCWSERAPWSVGRVLSLFRNTRRNNWLSQLAARARIGAVAVIGNDCQPEHRAILDAPRVTDIHRLPLAANGWGFIGIEGAITHRDSDGRTVNDIGLVLHPDEFVRNHLAKSASSMAVDPDRLVVVSHTPPARCLDVGIRFGVSHLGSRSLRSFVIQRRPRLVICGHCHSHGGMAAWLGKTLVVNVASDDTNVKRSCAVAITLVPGQPPRVQWLDPSDHSLAFFPGISLGRATRLEEVGITTVADLERASDAAFGIAGVPTTTAVRLRAHATALLSNSVVWVKQSRLRLPTRLLFYDVETGLGLERPHEPWVISAMIEGERVVHQWVETSMIRRRKRKMLASFLDFVRSACLDGDTWLCYWSGARFDVKAVANGLRRSLRGALRYWNNLQQVDLLCAARRVLVFPTRNWTLPAVATWLGYEEPSDGLTGLHVGVAYELFLRYGERLPISRVRSRSKHDVRKLAHVASWLRGQSPPLAMRAGGSGSSAS
jgi:Icc-related predicted phosphoesterase/uncharacterized protein YprB with RNaseH-like and TPR domain